MRSLVVVLASLTLFACEESPTSPVEEAAPIEQPGASAPEPKAAVELPPETPPANPRPGALVRSCAPFDGPSFELTIRRSGNREFPRGYAHVYLPLKGPAVFRVDDSSGQSGFARYCTTKLRCAEPSAFRVEVTPVLGEDGKAKRAFGQLVMLLRAGEKALPFDVEIDERPATCG
jgi:hypothetical protein